MKYLFVLVLLIPNYGISQSEEILKQAREKLEELDKAQYRSTFYTGGMAGEWYCDGVVNYENRDNNHLVRLRNNTDLLYNYFSNEVKLKLNQRLPPHSWFMMDHEQIQLGKVRQIELEINERHPFGTSKETIYNGREFLGHKTELNPTKINSDPIDLRTRSHLIVLDLLKGLEKKGKIISHFEGADTHLFILEGDWPQGSLRSNQVTYRKTKRIELVLDKKELLPIALYYIEEWGLSLIVWDDYKFDVPIDEKIWGLDENKNQDKEKLFFYEDKNGVDESYQISSTKVFYRGTELVNADPKSFRRLGKTYYRDGSKVYFKDRIVPNVDLETFDATHYYARDKNHVYFLDKIIVGADPTWFGLPDSTGKVQKFNYYYLSDGNEIYVEDNFKKFTRIENVDLKSFELLKPINTPEKYFVMCWAKDKNYVFNHEKIIKNADPATVVLIDQYHAKDKDHYIMGSNAFKNDRTFTLFPNLMAKNNEGVYLKGGTKLKDVDPKSFKYLNDFYQKDKDRVFYEGSKSLDADAATFKVVGNEYFGYDTSVVFCRHSPIKMADPSTWQWIGGSYSKDHKNVYLGTRIIEGADAASFKTVGNKRFGYDKNLVFAKSSPIKLANPATWQWIASAYSKDHKNVYYGNRIVPEGDPATFKVIEIEGVEFGEDKKGKYILGYFADEAKVQKRIKAYNR